MLDIREARIGSWARSMGVGVLCIIFLAARAAGQFTAGTILGTVSDPSRAVVAGATITATNLDTGFARAVKTDDVGSYTMTNMPLGKYRVRAEAPGFKAAESGPFELVVDQKLRSDFLLEVGSASEVVEVKGVGSTMLQADKADINQILQEREIFQLPLNGRDFFSLLIISNGIQDTSNDQGGATTNVTFSVNGMRPEANSVTLDGIEMSSIRESDVDLRPNLDAIAEFKVLTSAYSAEYAEVSTLNSAIASRFGLKSTSDSRIEDISIPSSVTEFASGRMPLTENVTLVVAPPWSLEVS